MHVTMPSAPPTHAMAYRRAVLSVRTRRMALPARAVPVVRAVAAPTAVAAAIYRAA